MSTAQSPVKTESKPAAASAVWDPFASLRRMSDELDRLVGAKRSILPALWHKGLSADWSPDLEMFERKGELVLRADLPGLSLADVKVEVTDDMLTIEGERKVEKEEKHEGVFRSERAYGVFSRAVSLPEGAASDQAKATFKDGVLEVVMPLQARQTTSARRLEVTSA